MLHISTCKIRHLWRSIMYLLDLLRQLLLTNADQLVTLLSNYALFIQCLIDMAKYPLRE